MKLSENTVKVLKNFSTINQGLVVKPGKTLRTISPNKAVLAEATVTEKFPHEFGIYDLNKSLSLLSMSTENEVEVEKEFLEFTGLAGRGKIRQRFTASNLILSPPDKKVVTANPDVTFRLSLDVLNWIFSVANVLKCPNFVFKGDDQDDGMQIIATDVKGQIVDDASVNVDATFDSPFSVAIKVENLKVIPQAYDVILSSNGLSVFTSEDESLKYWIAIEMNNSSFGD